MLWIFLLCAWLGSESDTGPASNLKKIDELNECVQVRFKTDRMIARPSVANPFGVTMPALGMSRMASPPSFSQHFEPNVSAVRDFNPENERETRLIAGLEADAVQVGFYLFGNAITKAEPEMLNFRALKGPAALTSGTPRPGWYPTRLTLPESPDALPDWRAIYPVAQKAMKSFADGGGGFETSIGSWAVAARPFIASQERCVACHNMPGNGGTATVELNHAIGGALYVFRQSRT